MGVIRAIAWKDLLLLMRDRSGFFWVLGMPILMALFFGAIFSSEGPRASMKVATVDLDGSARSKAFLEALGKSKAVELAPFPLETARDLVRKGERVAYLVLPKGMGEGSLFAPENDLEITLGIDPKRSAEAGVLNGLIQEAWFGQLQAAMADPDTMAIETAQSRARLEGGVDMDPDRREALMGLLGSLDRLGRAGNGGSSAGGMRGPTLRQESVTDDRAQPASSFEITFPQGILWGFIGICTAFSQSMVRERTMGTLQRLRIAPVTRGQLLAGKALACLLTIVAVSALLLALGSVLGVRVAAHLPSLALAVLCAGLGFVGLMVFLSVLGKTEQSVAGAGWAVMLVFSMTGGGMVPLMAMPQWMLTVSTASPVRWGITALEGAIWRGYSLTEMMLPCGILLAFGVVFYTLGVAILSKVESA